MYCQLNAELWSVQLSAVWTRIVIISRTFFHVITFQRIQNQCVENIIINSSFLLKFRTKIFQFCCDWGSQYFWLNKYTATVVSFLQLFVLTRITHIARNPPKTFWGASSHPKFLLTVKWHCQALLGNRLSKFSSGLNSFVLSTEQPPRMTFLGKYLVC